jgi:hypothetical protein
VKTRRKTPRSGQKDLSWRLSDGHDDAGFDASKRNQSAARTDTTLAAGFRRDFAAPTTKGMAKFPIEQLCGATGNAQSGVVEHAE